MASSTKLAFINNIKIIIINIQRYFYDNEHFKDSGRLKICQDPEFFQTDKSELKRNLIFIIYYLNEISCERAVF